MKQQLLIFSIASIFLTATVIASQKEDTAPNPADKLNQPEDEQKSADSKTEIPAATSRAQLLYEHHCLKCHESNVHIRKSKKAKNSDEVRSWVVKWQAHEDLNWNESEIDSVTLYLVQTYYNF